MRDKWKDIGDGRMMKNM